MSDKTRIANARKYEWDLVQKFASSLAKHFLLSKSDGSYDGKYEQEGYQKLRILMYNNIVNMKNNKDLSSNDKAELIKIWAAKQDELHNEENRRLDAREERQMRRKEWEQTMRQNKEQKQKEKEEKEQTQQERQEFWQWFNARHPQQKPQEPPQQKPQEPQKQRPEKKTCQELMCNAKIYSERDFRRWALTGHPDKIKGDLDKKEEALSLFYALNNCNMAKQWCPQLGSGSKSKRRSIHRRNSKRKSSKRKNSKFRRTQNKRHTRKKTYKRKNICRKKSINSPKIRKT